MRLILCTCHGLINLPDIDFGPEIKIERYKDLCHDKISVSADEKVVIAGCSINLMEGLFPDVDAEFVNLKDHVFLLKHSSDKAIQLLRAAIEKLKVSPFLKRKVFPLKHKNVVILGSGVAGLEVARTLSNAGIKTSIIEKEPFLGGTVALLDRLYPEATPWSHTLVPLISNVVRNRNVEILTNTEMTGFSGTVGDYKITLKSSPRGVIECNNCSACQEVCPVSINDNGRVRKAIYAIPTYPTIYAIDFDNCNKCGECVKVCPGKIELNAQAQQKELNAGAVVVATGLKFYDLSKVEEYGYSRIPGVMNTLEFERQISGGVIRPKSVMIICCAGSRDNNHLPYCSRVCCFLALKEAKLVKDRYPDTRVYVAAMDMRSYGNFEYFYTKLREQGITFVKGKPSEVTSHNGNLTVKVEDLYTNELLAINVDTVVLSGGFQPDKDTFDKLGIKTENNFPVLYESGSLGNFELPRGIFLAGSAGFPAGVAETIVDARKAALGVFALMQQEKFETLQPIALVTDDYCSICKTCISACPYNAISIVDNKIKINEHLCMGCGICASACPSSASKLERFTASEISRWIDITTKPGDILAFLCKWSAYNATESAALSNTEYPENVKIMRVPCSGAVVPQHIVQALTRGAKGVLIGGCYPDACHYAKGNYHARMREKILKQTLTLLGYPESRVRLEWIGKDEAKKFQMIVREMNE